MAFCPGEHKTAGGLGPGCLNTLSFNGEKKSGENFNVSATLPGSLCGFFKRMKELCGLHPQGGLAGGRNAAGTDLGRF